MAFTVAGSILGAGYVSGRELWQYFGSFGKNGIIGVVLSLALIAVCNCMVVIVAQKSGKVTIDEVAIRFDIPWIHRLVGIICDLFYFVTATIMVAGIGSLFNQLFGIPNIVGMIIAAFIIMFCVYFGIDLMVKIFDFTIPILVIAAIIICIIRLSSTGLGAVQFQDTNDNMLLGNWFNAALNYANLNLFAGIGILAPVANKLKSKSAGSLGVVTGAAFLLGIALAIILSISTNNAYALEDLPMLELAKEMGILYAAAYSVLLFIAMIGNGIATTNAITNHLEISYPILFIKKRRLATIVVLGIVSLIIAGFGFSNLIAVVYPIMGYFSIIMIVSTVDHRLHLR